MDINLASKQEQVDNCGIDVGDFIDVNSLGHVTCESRLTFVRPMWDWNMPVEWPDGDYHLRFLPEELARKYGLE